MERIHLVLEARGARLLPRRPAGAGQRYGLKRFGAMHAYTSSGVGTWGPPVRVGTKSEIVAVEFGTK